MTKFDQWTQEDLKTWQQSEPSSSPYDIALKIGIVVLLAVGLIALLWPAIAIQLDEAQAEWLGQHPKSAERLEQA